MKLFVGLGNPGGKYAKTRHNIGFMAVDAIAEGRGFSAERSKFQAFMREGRIGSAKVAVLKPQTFMNLSGQSVGEAMRYFDLEPSDVFVFHDELDLAPGRLKVKTGGGHAGHNGLRSLHEHIGPDYHRIRLGIGHPGDKNRVSGYVLHDFAKADWDWIDDLLRGCEDGAEQLAAGDFGGFMNKVALRTQPQRKGPEKTKQQRGAAAATTTTAATKAQSDPAATRPPTATPSAAPTVTPTREQKAGPANPFASLANKLFPKR